VSQLLLNSGAQPAIYAGLAIEMAGAALAFWVLDRSPAVLQL
jgi:hypothetical protein